VSCHWKKNRDETKRRFINWWNREGLLIGSCPWDTIPEIGTPHADVPDPGPPVSNQQRWADAQWRARADRHQLSRHAYPANILPLTDTNLGPGSLALFLGAEPEMDERTVWYRPCITDPESHPPLRFDAEKKWWKIQEAIIRENVRLREGDYIVACPDLIENFDILASLRGIQPLLVDLLEQLLEKVQAYR